MSSDALTTNLSDLLIGVVVGDIVPLTISRVVGILQKCECHITVVNDAVQCKVLLSNMLIVQHCVIDKVRVTVCTCEDCGIGVPCGHVFQEFLQKYRIPIP